MVLPLCRERVAIFKRQPTSPAKTQSRESHATYQIAGRHNQLDIQVIGFARRGDRWQALKGVALTRAWNKLSGTLKGDNERMQCPRRYMLTAYLRRL